MSLIPAAIDPERLHDTHVPFYLSHICFHDTPDASARYVRLILYGRMLSSSNLVAQIFAFDSNSHCFHPPLNAILHIPLCQRTRSFM